MCDSDSHGSCRYPEVGRTESLDIAVAIARICSAGSRVEMYGRVDEMVGGRRVSATRGGAWQTRVQGLRLGAGWAAQLETETHAQGCSDALSDFCHEGMDTASTRRGVVFGSRRS